MPAQGGVAAAAGVLPVDTHVATFVLPRFTFLVFLVTDDLTLGTGGIGWTVLGALVITCL